MCRNKRILSSLQIDLETFHLKASMSIERCFSDVHVRVSGSIRILSKIIEFEMYRKECDNENDDDSDRDDKLLECV